LGLGLKAKARVPCDECVDECVEGVWYQYTGDMAESTEHTHISYPQP